MRSLALIILLAITPALIAVSPPPAGRLQVKSVNKVVKSVKVVKSTAFNFSCYVKNIPCKL